METPLNPTAAPAAAAPVAAPAATSTPAVTTPASTTPAASTTPETPAAATTPLSSEDTVAAMVAAAEGKGFGKEKPAETETPVVTQPTNVDEKTPEEKAAEAAAATSGAGQDDEESYTLDDDGFVGAKDLAAKIEANAALKAALPEEVRNEIMANARLAEFGASMREHFASPEEAKIISESAQEYAGMIEAFQGVNVDPNKGATNFVMKLLEASALRNADGTPQKDKDGNFLTDGTVGKLLNTLTDRRIHNEIIAKVKALGDENVQAALDLVMESVGLRPSTAAQDHVTDPALQARKAELDAQEARIKADSAASTQATWKAYNESVSGDLASLYDGAVGKLLDSATGLDSFTRGAVEKELESTIRNAIRTNTAYQMERKRIEAMPPTPERRQAEVALAKRFFLQNLARVAKPVMEKAGIAVSKKAGERAAAQAARTENVRSEINGGAPIPISQGSPANATQQREAIAAQLKASTGHDPNESEISIALMMAAARAKGFAA